MDLVRDRLYPELRTLGGRLLLDALLVAGAIFLLGLVFHFIERLQTTLEGRNAELLALHHAAIDISGELVLETVLQKVVDGARSLLHARYGALSVVEETGAIRSFITSGIDRAQRDRMDHPPEGRGLLGVVLTQGERLRLRDLTQDPRAAGFPLHHPKMTSLLAVPIPGPGRIRGNLYLADKKGEPEFTRSDEETLLRFATQAAIAIDTAHLHQQLRGLAVAEERLRIAHEMHDGLAQVLAYVGTKAQAVREYLRSGRPEEAVVQLDQLATAAREVYGEVREGILALRAAGRTGRPIDEALSDYLIQWQDQTGIEADIALEAGLTLAPERELQLVRIAQEALANVRKHSGAQRVALALARRDGKLCLDVTDDGRGFSPAAPHAGGAPRFGLATMRERAQAIGGELEIDSAPGRGTQVRLRVPLGGAA
jgi:signal transduction histidine kinase